MSRWVGYSGGSRWVGGKSFKRNRVWGGGKIKFQKKNWDQGRSGLRNGKPKKSTWDGTGIENRILSVHHPSTLVHWWVLLHPGRRFGEPRLRLGTKVQSNSRIQFASNQSNLVPRKLDPVPSFKVGLGVAWP